MINLRSILNLTIKDRETIKLLKILEESFYLRLKMLASTYVKCNFKSMLSKGYYSSNNWACWSLKNPLSNVLQEVTRRKRQAIKTRQKNSITLKKRKIIKKDGER